MSGERINRQNAEQKERSSSYKKYLMFSVFIVAIFISILFGLKIYIYNTPENRLERQLEIAGRWLEELDYNQAVIEFTKAIEIDPKSMDAYLGMAEAYEGMKNYEQAIAKLTEALEIEPDNQNIQNTLEQVYLDMIQTQLDNHIEMAQKYLYKMDFDKAIAELMAALEIEPDSKRVHDILEQIYLKNAQTLIEQGKYDEAIDNLSSGYELLQRTKLAQLREKAYQAKKQEEFLNEKRIIEDKVFGDSENDPELTEYKRKAVDFIYSVIEESWGEGYRDTSVVWRIEVKENDNAICRMIVIIEEGKPLQCYEVEFNKKNGQGRIEDCYDGDEDENGELIFFNYGNDVWEIIGRTFD